MEYRKYLDKLDSCTSNKYKKYFDRSLYCMGVFLPSYHSKNHMDLELSLLTVSYLVGRKDMASARFLGPLVAFLLKNKTLVNKQKLKKMWSYFGEEKVPLMRLVMFLLGSTPKGDYPPFYLDLRMKPLVDRKLEAEGFFMNLPRSLGLMLPSNSLRVREDDLLSDDLLFSRNPQLKERLFLGPSFRADVNFQLKRNPSTSASDLEKRFAMTHEPAFRLLNELKRAYSVNKGQAAV